MQPSQVIAVALLCLSCVWACSKQHDISPEQAIELADAAVAQDKPRDAMIYLKSALKTSPHNLEIRRQLAEVYLMLGDGSAAEIEIDKAVQQGYPALEAALPLARALLMQGQYQEVLTTLATTVDTTLTKQVERSNLTGQAYLGLNEPGEADRAFSAALAIDAKNAKAVTGKAQVLLALGDQEQARMWLEQALEFDPKFALAWRLKADLARAAGQLDEAEFAYTQAIQNRSGNALDRLQRAMLRISRGDFDGAKDDADAIPAPYNKSPEVAYVRGLAAFGRQQTDTALANFENVVRLDPNHLGAIFFLGVINAQRGNLEQAEHQLRRFVDKRPDVAQASLALAMIRLQQNDLAGAKAVLTPALQHHPDNLSLAELLASLHLAQGHGAAAEPLLRKVVAQQPDSASTLTKLGVSLLLTGKVAEGRAILADAAEVGDNLPRAKILLIFSHLKDGDPKEALELAEELVADNPESAGAHALIGTVLAELQEYDRAREAFDTAWKIKPGHIIAGRSLARLDLQKGDRDAAYQRYTDVLAKHPGNVPVSVAAAQLDLASKDLETAELRLKQAIANYPDDPRPRTLLAQTYQAVGRLEDALSIVASPSAQALGNPAFLEVAGRLNHRAGRFDTADELFTRLVALAPTSSQAYLYRGLSLQGLGNNEAARSALERAITLDPTNRNARASLAGLEIREQRFTAAKNQIDALNRLSETEVEVLALQARWQAGQRRFDKAAEVMRELITLQPTSDNAASLVDLHFLAGNPDESFATARDWLKRNPDDTRVRLLFADLLQRASKTEESRQSYASVLQRAPNNPIAHNNLANLIQASDPTAALEHAKKAYDLVNGEVAAIADTYGWILLDTKPNEALRILREAHQRAKQVPEIAYHYAVALNTNGFADQAKRLLTTLMDQDFAGKDEAKRLLDTLE